MASDAPNPPSARKRRPLSPTHELATGLALVLVGGVFLAGPTLGLDFGDGWALFVAILGATALAWAWAYRTYDRAARLPSHEAARAATTGAVPLSIAPIFLFDLDRDLAWPVRLAVAGVAAPSVRRGEAR